MLNRTLRRLIYLTLLGLIIAYFYYNPQIWTELTSFIVPDNRIKVAIPSEHKPAKVLHIIDGDSLIVQHDDSQLEEIRLIGFNAGEIQYADQPAECFAQESVNFLNQQLKDQPQVILVTDSQVGNVDQYNRSLRYLLKEDGTDLAALMIHQGMGKQLKVQDYQHQNRYLQLENEAKNQQKGLWNPQICPPQ